MNGVNLALSGVPTRGTPARPVAGFADRPEDTRRVEPPSGGKKLVLAVVAVVLLAGAGAVFAFRDSLFGGSSRGTSTQKN